ncbi:Clavesin-2 [Labeo rohita]|uniref:Clavesin-2 n=1 Tax=Labeo rohita TaxID=84645 RepID=A0ABQ8LNG7_LABRO|nr:Clavesin-2 [Labeo rohita]
MHQLLCVKHKIISANGKKWPKLYLVSLVGDTERTLSPPPPCDDGQTVSPERCLKSLSSATKRSNSSSSSTDVNRPPHHRNHTEPDRHHIVSSEGRLGWKRSAERDWDRLSPETLEKAKVELKENPDTLHQDIQEVRDMIITRPDIGFLRTDDAFILRFLRARKFNHFEAFRLLAQYFEYRQQNLDMFKNLKATDPGIKQALKDGFPGVLSNLDRYGRKILVLFAANWDQSSNFTFKQASKLTPSMLRLAIEGLQVTQLSVFHFIFMFVTMHSSNLYLHASKCVFLEAMEHQICNVHKMCFRLE